jgi:hypothetical protein
MNTYTSTEALMLDSTVSPLGSMPIYKLIHRGNEKLLSFPCSPHFTVYVSSSARSRAPACQFCKKPLYSLEIAAKSGSSNPNPLAFFSQSPFSFPHPTAAPACSPPAPMPHNSGSTAPCPPAALPPPSPDSHPPSVAACLRQHLGRRCIPTGTHPGLCRGGATNADGAQRGAAPSRGWLRDRRRGP